MTTNIQIRVTEELKARLMREAEAKSTTVSELIRDLLEDYAPSTIEQLKKELEELNKKLFHKQNQLDKSLLQQKNNTELLEKEAQIIKKNEYFTQVRIKLGKLEGKDRIDFINLKIKENKFPELKEELIELKEWVEKKLNDNKT